MFVYFFKTKCQHVLLLGAFKHVRLFSFFKIPQCSFIRYSFLGSFIRYFRVCSLTSSMVSRVLSIGSWSIVLCYQTKFWQIPSLCRSKLGSCMRDCWVSQLTEKWLHPYGLRCSFESHPNARNTPFFGQICSLTASIVGWEGRGLASPLFKVGLVMNSQCLGTFYITSKE